MRDGAQAVDRACALLNAFSPERPVLGLKELATIVGINKSTAHRLLGAMCAAGLVLQDPKTHEYAPGMRLVVLGNVALARMDIARIAMPAMTRLAAAVRETAYLATYAEHGAAYLAVAEGPRTIRLTAHVGMVLPLHSTATGKVLLAALSKEEVAKRLPRTLPRLTPKTVTKAALGRELKRVQQQGYAISYDEHEVGICSIAVAIRDDTGVIAALAVS
ncbi:MAG: IclR family transcriptional regulator, regulon repressor, partial [Chloroflexota bacterium]|nr:IclR family transcriptional regulator, regulon repressor [Chloroflexota bacterium]